MGCSGNPDKDELGNACIGDVLISQSKNNLICANTRLVSLVDVNDIVVIETPGSTSCEQIK